jgi:hypothetical protein
MTSDVVPRLLKAIGAAEQRVAAKSEWGRPYDESWHTLHCGWQLGEEIHDECECGVPAAVLRRCAADRRQVERHKPISHHDGFTYCATCGSGEPYEYPTDWPCDTLKDIAEPYGVTDTADSDG